MKISCVEQLFSHLSLSNDENNRFNKKQDCIITDDLLFDFAKKISLDEDETKREKCNSLNEIEEFDLEHASLEYNLKSENKHDEGKTLGQVEEKEIAILKSIIDKNDDTNLEDKQEKEKIVLHDPELKKEDVEFETPEKKNLNCEAKITVALSEDPNDEHDHLIEKEIVKPSDDLEKDKAPSNCPKSSVECSKRTEKERKNEISEPLQKDKMGQQHENSPSKEVDDSDDENEVKFYLTRGPLIDSRAARHRFTPLQLQNGLMNNENFNYQRKLKSTDVHYNQFEYHQPSTLNDISFPGNFGNGFQNQFETDAQFFSNDPHFQSSTFLSPAYHPEDPSPTFFPELIADSKVKVGEHDWLENRAVPPQNSFNFDHLPVGVEQYLPLSPPHSVSSMIKDGNDSTGSLENSGSFSDAQTPEESEDLINIINTISETHQIESNQMPEFELSRLRNALEGDGEASVRNEMDMYLNGEPLKSPDRGQEITFSPTHSNSNYLATVGNYDPPLTPPNSVTPVLDDSSHYGLFSPNETLDSLDGESGQGSESHLSDILNGIEEIGPDELNIYLNEDNVHLRPALVKKAMHDQCMPSLLDYALRRLSSISCKELCKQDEDGDTCLMIVYSKLEESPSFYENIFCLQEKMLEIRLCCDAYLGRAKKCKICGSADASAFYTPLSLWNNHGDTALTCAVKRNHSTLVVDFILCGILQNQEDFRRVFSYDGKMALRQYADCYPSLKPYV